MGMILRIASSRIVGQGDIVGRSGYFSLNLSANSVMRGRLDARRTLKSLVADLRVTLKEMTPAVLVSMSVIQLSLHLADRVAFATGFSIVYSIWKGPPSAGTSRLSLANTISGCASGVTGSSLLHPAKSEEPKIPPPKIINNHTNLKYFIV